MVCIPDLWPFVPGPEVSAPTIGKNGKGLFLNDGTQIRDRIKVPLLRPRRYCGRDVLIRNPQKFTI